MIRLLLFVIETVLVYKCKCLPIDQIIQAAAVTDVYDGHSSSDRSTVLYELDIMQNKTEYLQQQDTHAMGSTTHRKKRKAIRDQSYRWTNNTIPYVVQDLFFSYEDRQQIRHAMDEWERYTCIRFKPRSSEHNYVYFMNGYGCSSFVGMNGGPQLVELAPGCRDRLTIIHELGHAVGFYHEQSRPDRNDHVTIINDNIKAYEEHNFEVHYDINTYGVPYDYTSVMHYGEKFFSRSDDATIRTKDPAYQNIIGNARDLSFRDIKLANLMYSCSSHCSDEYCPGEGFIGKDCKCWCPGSPLKECEYCTSDNIANGYLQSDSYTHERVIKNGETGKYHCDLGYTRETSYNEVKCMFSLVHARSSYRLGWSTHDYEYNDTPSCKPKVCEVPSNDFTSYKTSKYGYIITGHRESGDSIYVSCGPDDVELVEVHDNSEVDRTNRNTMRCSRGKWNRQLKCREKPCEVPSNDFTAYTTSQYVYFTTGLRESGGSIYVSCESDYYEQIEVYDNGDIDRTSRYTMLCSRGKWNRQLKCQEKSCPIDDKNNIIGRNGQNIERDYFNHGISLAIKCKDGYHFKHHDNVTFMRIKCNHGNWFSSNSEVTLTCEEHFEQCPANQFQCNNGRCLDPRRKCNGYDECGDGSDEIDCACAPNKFQCNNGRCLDPRRTCNGYDECGDGSDEIDCDVVPCQVPEDDTTIYIPDGVIVTPGNIVTVTCRSEEYEVSSGQTTGHMTCGRDGTWNPEIHCQPKSCQVIPMNGGEFMNINSRKTINKATWFKHGFDALRLNCDDGLTTEHGKNFLRAVCLFGKWKFFVKRYQTIQQLRCFPSECQLEDMYGVKYFDGLNEINPRQLIGIGWGLELSYTCHKSDSIKVTCMLGQWEPPVQCHTVREDDL